MWLNKQNLRKLKREIKYFFSKKKQKVFCIGQNKTGTTSLEDILYNLGYKMGDQSKAELLIHDWAKRDFKSIVKFCHTADAFQDAPFSYDFTYQTLDYAFPNSKFIMTIRNNKEEWYGSYIRFQTKLVGKNRLPTADDLKEFPYRYKGWLWERNRLNYDIDETTLYDHDIYTSQYERHNQRVRDYFRFRPDDLLIVNLAEPDAMKKIYQFLGFKYNGEKVPHINRTK
jgi:hypothetical protein